jgi:hypothetical protein
MRAQVIDISSVSRNSPHHWEEEASLTGFTKALGLIHSLRLATWKEQQAAIENWVACGTLTAAERDAIWEFFGWERAS